MELQHIGVQAGPVASVVILDCQSQSQHWSLVFLSRLLACNKSVCFYKKLHPKVNEFCSLSFIQQITNILANVKEQHKNSAFFSHNTYIKIVNTLRTSGHQSSWTPKRKYRGNYLSKGLPVSSGFDPEQSGGHWNLRSQDCKWLDKITLCLSL